MIQNLKKYNLWLIYGCMWIFSFFTIWYISIVMYYTLVHVTENGYSSDFLKEIATLSNVPIRSFYISTLGFLFFFAFVILRRQIKLLNHHQIFSVLIELILSLIIMKNISFSTTCILYLVIADSLLYVDKTLDRTICIVLVFTVYMFSNYGYLSNYIPMISFQEYLSVYTSQAQSVFSGIAVTLSNLDLVFFIAYIFLYLQKQMDETQKFAALNAELNRLNIQLKGYANLREKMGETKERNRLAREIHDTLGHTLTGLSVGLEACKVMLDKNPEATKAQLNILEESAKRGLTDVRRSVDKLKPDALERYSLKEALDMMIMDFQKMTDVTVLYLCHLPLVHLNADEEEIVYRVVQEGMTNAVRHGHATKIYVSIAQTDNNLIIIIEDNGQGCKVIEPGFGIYHLTERINLLQGRIRYYGNNGFELIVEIPMRRS